MYPMTDMTNDFELLRAYVVDGSETAFRTIVQRHLGFVYSSALRQVRDPHLADEVAQAVFVILARKAGSLDSATLLPSWLFRTTRFASGSALRSVRRRQRYQQEAAQMQPTILPTPDASARNTRKSAALWERVKTLHGAELCFHAG